MVNFLGADLVLTCVGGTVGTFGATPDNVLSVYSNRQAFGSSWNTVLIASADLHSGAKPPTCKPYLSLATPVFVMIS